MEDEDVELQLALALSLGQEGVGPVPEPAQGNNTAAAQQGASGSTQQQAQQQQPTQGQQGQPSLAGQSSLQSILAAALSAAASGGGAAPAPTSQPRPSMASPSHTTPASTTGRPFSAPPRPQNAPLPGWIDRTVKWWLNAPPTSSQGSTPQNQPPPDFLGAPNEPIVLKSSADVDAFLGFIGKAMGTPVALRVGSTAPARKDALQLKATSSDGATTITRADLSACIDNWRMRPSLMVGGRSQLRILYDAFAALPWTDAQGDVGWACGVMASLLGRKAFEQLASDEDDLYYDKGQVTSEVLLYLKGAAPHGHPMFAAFLEAIVRSVKSEADTRVVHKLVRDVVAEFHNLKQLGGSIMDLEPYVLMLDVFSSPPVMQRVLVSMLLTEVLTFSHASRHKAKNFEAGTVLGALLQVSSLVDPASALRMDIQSRARQAFFTLKGYPNKSGDIETVSTILHSLSSRLQDAGHSLLKRLLTCKEVPDGAPACKEVVLAWLCLAAELNMDRTAMGERGLSGPSMVREMTAGCSDAAAVNLAAILLRFARPFVSGFWSGSPKFADLFPKHLSPAYYASQPHRTQELALVSSLAGERGFSVAHAIAKMRESPEPSAHLISLPPPISSMQGYLADVPGGPGTPSFMADCFFLAQKMLHVGLMPAVFRYKRLMEYYVRTSKPEALRQDPKVYLLQHCSMAGLMEPSLVEDAVQFCMLQITWLRHLLITPPSNGNAHSEGTPQQQQQQQQQAKDGRELVFGLIPDCVLSDSLSWLNFVIRSGQAVFIASKDIGTLTSGLVALLDNTRCVRSTLLHDKIVTLLLSMLGPQLEVENRTIKGKLGATIMRPGEAALIASVLNSHAAQSGALVTSLMRAYCAADYVVGLDVDKDSFDKYNMRAHIDMILEELWNDDRCRACIVQLASSQDSSGSIFSDYVECLFNALIYLFKDSLGRLSDIAKVEAAKADAAGWAGRPSEERESQEAFLESTQGTARGYMRMAVASLGWINKLAEHPQAAAAFCRQPLAGRVAGVLLHFTELLIGPKCGSIQVQDPEQYSFDRPSLLESVLSLMVLLASVTFKNAGSAFVEAIAQEPDLDLGVLSQALSALEANYQVTSAMRLKGLISKLEAVQAGQGQQGKPSPLVPTQGSTPESVGAPSPAGKPLPPAKRSKRGDGEPSTSSGDTEGAAAPSASEDQVMQEAQAPPYATTTSASSEGPQGVAVQLGEDGLPVLPDPPLPDDQLAAQYREQLGDLCLGSFDSSQPRAYHSGFHKIASSSEGVISGAKMKRLTRELRDLAGKATLPCDPAASIFLRHDADNLDKMRAILTGPEGTPYAFGCFAFDLYYPCSYPETAMLVNFETTGQGRARFNPNLYADGKVCLSLINTWHASHESEKWNPNQTTTFQVLVSIQAMILVQDPYYNEPAHDATRGTDIGRSSAASYNAELTLNCMRYACIDKIKNPPPGFEEVVLKHFKLVRHKLAATARSWAAAAAETGDELLAKRSHGAAKELISLLAAL